MALRGLRRAIAPGVDEVHADRALDDQHLALSLDHRAPDAGVVVAEEPGAREQHVPIRGRGQHDVALEAVGHDAHRLLEHALVAVRARRVPAADADELEVEALAVAGHRVLPAELDAPGLRRRDRDHAHGLGGEDVLALERGVDLLRGVLRSRSEDEPLARDAELHQDARVRLAGVLVLAHPGGRVGAALANRHEPVDLGALHQEPGERTVQLARLVLVLADGARVQEGGTGPPRELQLRLLGGAPRHGEGTQALELTLQGGIVLGQLADVERGQGTDETGRELRGTRLLSIQDTPQC